MREYQFQYPICSEPDEKLFYRQCKALEKNIPGLQKSEQLEDVDGSLIQIYRHELGEVKVTNSFYVGALYVDADFDLLPYFKK